ncbi:AraC family transcriptional regulator [Bradyrhizobium sp.]|uniref:AraC family transcriptional regulator n=1 Tax=Bradyrhizobium sp. TaxID=376 RepID=UPI001D1D2DA8|nr:helix-turn-helix domain-containing protein [Bradyrhizobium sp.]MBV8700911.1 AraC family transcriptional regulator [Bradyrhizobium sp.]MBV8919414.1 AraC family transcriptional regulator [Bradyrhizobium sp.]
MALSRVFSFDDPSACQTVFPSADVELFPTAKGDFHADVTQVAMSGIWVHQIHISLPEINTVAVRPGRRSIGFLTEGNSSSLLDCGLDVRPGDIVMNRSDVVHQRSEADFHYGTVSLPSEYLAAAAEALLGHELPEPPRRSTLRPPSALMLRLLSIHKSIGQLAHDAPDILEIPQVSRALENALSDILVRCLAAGHAVELTAARRSHDTILLRFVEFLEANPDRPLYLTEICAAIGAAERTLRASCEEHLAMGPIRYLTLRRMHLVRRALLAADPSVATVTRIVTAHGFWELGRFSVAYRALFGESPSETLRQPAEQFPTISMVCPPPHPQNFPIRRLAC